MAQAMHRDTRLTASKLYQRNLVFQKEKKMRSGDLYPPFHEGQPLLASYNVIM